MRVGRCECGRDDSPIISMSLCQKSAPSDTSSVCGLSLILMITCLFHCSAYLKEETLKINKKIVVNKLSMKEHTKKMKNIAFFNAKWPPKGGTLQYDRLISFVPMFNLHRCVQLACNLKTVKINFFSDITDNVNMFLFLRKFTLKIQWSSITRCVYTHDEHKCCLLL